VIREPSGPTVERALDALAASVLNEMIPVDRWAVAVALEVRGLRDVDAVRGYDRENIFALADEVYARCRRLLVQTPPCSPNEGRSSEPEHLGAARLYWEGLLSALPVVVPLILIVMGFGVSREFSDRDATALVLGMILSFVTAGGPMQAIERLGSYYREQASYALAEALTGRVVGLGLALAVSGALVWSLFCVVLGAFPGPTVLATAVYTVLLAALWLALAVLRMQRRYLLILLSVAVWIATFALLTALSGMPVAAAQWTGIATAAAIAHVFGHTQLCNRPAIHLGGGGTRLPRGWLLVSAAAPYFTFGVLYFCFLFVDRIVGWSTDTPPGYPIFFSRAYETGLIYALISMVPTIALLHGTMHRLTSHRIAAQRRFGAAELEAHNRSFERFYRRRLYAVAGTALMSVGAAYLLARGLDGSGPLRSAGGLSGAGELGVTHPLDPSAVPEFVFWWAGLGYGLLAWGLLNTSILFSLSEPSAVLRAILAGAVISVVLGLVLSRSLGYWYSVAGLAAGALVFALLSAAALFPMLRRTDYYLYAAA